MKAELFNELLESVHEGGAILRGAKLPSRKSAVDKRDVQKIRVNSQLAQKEFTSIPGITTDKRRKNDR